MFKINLHGAEAIWHNFPKGSTDKNRDCRLKIQKYPASKSQMVIQHTDKETYNVIVSGKEKEDAFCECLVDVEDLQDSEGKPIKLNQKIIIISSLGEKKITMKQYIYNYEFESGLPMFVLTEAGLVKEEVKKEEKNSGNGQDGSGVSPS